MTKEKLLDKVRKLMAKAESTNFEAEAETFTLKAQELIAQYNLDISKLSDEERKEIHKLVKAVHSNNEGYRKPLSVALAKNFRCEAIIIGNTVHFFGHDTDAQACTEVFNRLYKVSHGIGLKLERKAREEGRSTAGVANSYWTGFISGISKALGDQSVALAVIVPQDVKDELQARYDLQPGKGGIKMKGYDQDAFKRGVEDGKESMSRKKLG